jgi:GNAT superfamily N-acetyltransferase
VERWVSLSRDAPVDCTELLSADEAASAGTLMKSGVTRRLDARQIPASTPLPNRVEDKFWARVRGEATLCGPFEPGLTPVRDRRFDRRQILSEAQSTMTDSIENLAQCAVHARPHPSVAGAARALREGLKQAGRRLEAVLVGLEARELAGWGPELEAALDALPELPRCPRALLRVLFASRPDTPKRTVLLTDHGTPVGVVALRYTPWGWEPLTTWIVPGPPIPVREGDLARALRAVGLTMKIAWWRCTEPTPTGAGISLVTDEPTYGIELASNYSAHWRRNHVKSVDKAVRRCADFRFELNLPGAARWTLTNAAQKWGIPIGITEDRVAVAGWLERNGRHHTAMLFDGERPVAGNTMYVDKGDLVGCTMYRDPDYDRFGVGLALMHRILEWASHQAFARLDFGGGGTGGKWKSDWAPEAGRKIVLRVTPLYATAAAWLRKLRRPQVVASAVAILACLANLASSLADFVELAA